MADVPRGAPRRGGRTLGWGAVLAAAALVSGCTTGAATPRPMAGPALSHAKATAPAAAPAPAAASEAGEAGNRGRLDLGRVELGGSVVFETAGAYRLRLMVVRSLAGDASQVARFAATALPGPPTPVSLAVAGVRAFLAVEVRITNLGTQEAPPVGVTAGGPGFPLVAVADPDVLAVGRPARDGLACPYSAPSGGATGFVGDAAGVACVVAAQVVLGPVAADGSVPSSLDTGESAYVVAIFALRPLVAPARVHLAVPPGPAASSAGWQPSVPVEGGSGTMAVVLAAA